MHQLKKQKIIDLNPHLICQLCGGYYIDAATIIECLHSFCRSCIVRYLEKNKFCPVCEVQVHKTKPLLNIRPDQTLQDIVYKLVPGLFQNEMRLRREFYSKHPAAPLPQNPEDQGEQSERHIYSPDETVSLSLEYSPSKLDAEPTEAKEDEKEAESSYSRRYLRCPAAVTIGLLKRLIRGKYGLDFTHVLDLIYEDKVLRDEYTLVDLAYISNWRRKGPMRLKYRIYQRLLSNIPIVNGTPKNVASVESKSEPPLHSANTECQVDITNSKPDVENGQNEDVQAKEERHKLNGESSKLTPDEPMKEVQLEISESGVMSVLEVDVIGTPTCSEMILNSGKANSDPLSIDMQTNSLSDSEAALTNLQEASSLKDDQSTTDDPKANPSDLPKSKVESSPSTSSTSQPTNSVDSPANSSSQPPSDLPDKSRDASPENHAKDPPPKSSNDHLMSESKDVPKNPKTHSKNSIKSPTKSSTDSPTNLPVNLPANPPTSDPPADNSSFPLADVPANPSADNPGKASSQNPVGPAKGGTAKSANEPTKSTSDDPSTSTNGPHLFPRSSPPSIIPTSKKPMSPVGYKTLKSPPKSWNPSLSRGTKRSASSLVNNKSSSSSANASAPSNTEDVKGPSTPKQSKKTSLAAPSPPKAPRFFKVRNSTSLATSSSSTAPVTTSTSSSAAPLLESPVQEVAVNLTKVSQTAKKSLREIRVPSPQSSPSKPPASPTPRPSSAPAPAQPLLSPPAVPSPSSCEDAASKLRVLLNPLFGPVSSTASPTCSTPPHNSLSMGESLQMQLRFPLLPNLGRVNSRSPLSLPPGAASFLTQPPHPAHLLSSLIASHTLYPYLPPQVSFGLGPRVSPLTDQKKSPSSVAPTTPASSPSSGSSALSHKASSPRPSSAGFHSPSFNLNSPLSSYPPALNPLMPGLPRELVGPLYATYSPCPYSPVRSTATGISSPSVTTSTSLPFPKSPPPSSGGFHASLPPTVTPSTKGPSSNKTPGLRPLMPRKSSAPPPPLVPIGSRTPSEKNSSAGTAKGTQGKTESNTSSGSAETSLNRPAKKLKDSTVVDSSRINGSSPGRELNASEPGTHPGRTSITPIENGKMPQKIANSTNDEETKHKPNTGPASSKDGNSSAGSPRISHETDKSGSTSDTIAGAETLRKDQ